MSRRPRTPILVALSLLTLLSLGGCGDLLLTGSLSTVYPLQFESLRARLYASSLSIEYVRVDGSVPVRVTIDRSAVEAGTDIDLLETGDVTGRTPEGRELPRFSEGSIRFDPFDLTAGAVASGDFGATFDVTETDTLALHGRFSAELEVVEEPGPPAPGRDGS